MLAVSCQDDIFALMGCDQKSVAELNGYTFENVEFGLALPDFTKPELIFIDHQRISRVARAIGSQSLRIVTEVGPVSDRVYGASLSNTDWRPRIGNTASNNRNVPALRIATANEPDANLSDWVILNTSEINDRFQEDEHFAHSLTGLFTEFKEVKTKPIQVTWSLLIHRALTQGLRELAAQKRRNKEITFIDQFKAKLLTSRHSSLAHSHQ
jgi:hypothetical protein